MSEVKKIDSMTIKELRYDQETGLIYCNTNKGYYTINGEVIASMIAFTLTKKTVEDENMLNYFAVILEALYEDREELFEFVQHVIKYEHKGIQKEMSFNLYIDAVDTLTAMRQLDIYNNIEINFMEV